MSIALLWNSTKLFCLLAQFLRLEVWVLVDASVWSTGLCHKEADGIVSKANGREKKQEAGEGSVFLALITSEQLALRFTLIPAEGTLHCLVTSS